MSEPIKTLTVSDSEIGSTNENLDINITCIEFLIQATKNIDGIDELVDMFLMCSCIQSDPGEPKD